MTFREATDRLAERGVGLAAVADALGVSYATVKQARLDASSPSYRKPPEGWEPVLAALARKRGGELLKLAERLEREG